MEEDLCLTLPGSGAGRLVADTSVAQAVAATVLGNFWAQKQRQ